MGLLERIKEIEDEMARTQKNKATEGHLGRLKAQVAKFRAEVMNETKAGGKGEGWEVKRQGNARVVLIGFPSVGKSTLMNSMTNVESEIAAYEFTTLTCVPGVFEYNGAKIQLLDLPGIIEGASEGKGRGRQVIATAKSADVILMVLDATKDDSQKKKLERELAAIGVRLNRTKPQMTLKLKKTGGLSISSSVVMTKMTNKHIEIILKEYKIFNADISIFEDVDADDVIDTVLGNCSYIKCIYVYNKIDMTSLEEVDEVARRPYTCVISSSKDWNIDTLKEMIWNELEMVRVYTKRKGEYPDFDDPIILTNARGGCNVKTCITKIHQDMVKDFKTALVWGSSVVHNPQQVSINHDLEDEDVIQMVSKVKT